MPKISVIMPVCNGEYFLEGSINSVLNQTYDDFELIIINDGSVDSSLEIIKSYKDARIRLVENGSNLGLVATRNKALTYAKGEFVAMLDCDDVALPTRLAEQVSFLEANPDFGLVGSWVEVINEQSKPTGEVWRLNASADDIPCILLFNNYFTQSAVMIRKSLLEQECYRQYPGAEDYDLWIRIARKSKVWNLQKVLVKYRVQSGSISFTNAKKIEEYVREIVGDQLSLMGLRSTPDELAIHRQIARLPSGDPIKFIAGADSWLRKIYRQNLNSRQFEPASLRRCLGGKWLSVCRVSGHLINQIWSFVSHPDLCWWAMPELMSRVRQEITCRVLLPTREKFYGYFSRKAVHKS